MLRFENRSKLEELPGDLVFDDWDQSDFELVSIKEWADGRILHLERKK